MKKLPEKVRNRLRREKILKAVAVELVLLVLLSLALWRYRPVTAEDLETETFYADTVETYYSRRNSIDYITHDDTVYKFTVRRNHLSYEGESLFEDLRTQRLTVSALPKPYSIINTKIIVDLRSEKDVFLTMQDFNKERRLGRIELVILFFVISFLVQGGFFFLLDKISYLIACIRLKRGKAQELNISEYIQAEKRTIKHKKRRKKK